MKPVKGLFPDNHKPLLIESLKTQNKWKATPWSWQCRLRVVKVLIPPVRAWIQGNPNFKMNKFSV